MHKSRVGAALAGVLAAMTAGKALAACQVGKMAELPITLTRGVPLTPVKVNGRTLQFVVSSGRPFSQIDASAARSLGLAFRSMGRTRARGGGLSEYSAIEAHTLQGAQRVQVASVRDFGFGGAEIHDFELTITPDPGTSEISGALGENILGVNDAEYDLAHGVVRLFKTDGCQDTSMAYWATDGVVNVIDEPVDKGRLLFTRAYAYVNGQKMRVLLDSGAEHSVLSLAAAARAGIRPTSPGVVPAGDAPDVSRMAHTWIAPVASFQIGDEDIKSTRLRIGDFDFRDFDMLLGADFLKSHRLYVSSWQRRIYFTYDGGPVFDLSTTR